MRKLLSSLRIADLVFLGVGIILFIYLFIRSVKVGITHDEALTYQLLNGEWKLGMTANNHPINTLLTFLTTFIFGFSEWAMRLPNVLSFGLYAWFCHGITMRYSVRPWVAWFGLSFLLLNPFLLDFFALSRGYGLAMAFLSGSIFYFLRFHEESSLKNLRLALGFSILTIYSNYSFIYPLLVFHMFLLYSLIWRKQKGWWNDTTKSIALELVLLVPALVHLIGLKYYGQLFHGGDLNIIDDTLSKLWQKTYFPGANPFKGMILTLLTFLFILLSLIYVRKNRFFKLVFLSMIGCFILIIAFHYSFDILYPKGRSALYWVILMGVFVHFLSEAAFSSLDKPYSKSFLILLIPILIGNSFNFFSRLNFTHTTTWNYDAGTPEVLETLRQKAKPNETLNFAVSWTLLPAVNYYKSENEYNWLNPIILDGADPNVDFYYYRKRDIKSWGDPCLQERPSEDLIDYEIANTWLIQCKSNE